MTEPHTVAADYEDMSDPIGASRGNWFQRANPSTPWVLALSWVAVLVLGLLWLWLPVLAGFSEIYYPGGGVDMFFWGLIAASIAPVAFGFHFVGFSVAFARSRSANYLVLMLALIGLLTGLYFLLYPVGERERQTPIRIDPRAEGYGRGGQEYRRGQPGRCAPEVTAKLPRQHQVTSAPDRQTSRAG